MKTSNVARESAIRAGYPVTLPAHTVSMACIGGNQAVTSCIGMIEGNVADVCIAGGVEYMSDVPIKHSREMRLLMFKASLAKTQKDLFNHVKKLRPRFLMPDIPAITEFSTDETMGYSADKLAGMHLCKSLKIPELILKFFIQF